MLLRGHFSIVARGQDPVEEKTGDTPSHDMPQPLSLRVVCAKPNVGELEPRLDLESFAFNIAESFRRSSYPTFSFPIKLAKCSL